MSEPMRILVEDDDKAICQLLNSVLKHTAVRSHTAKKDAEVRLARWVVPTQSWVWFHHTSATNLTCRTNDSTYAVLSFGYTTALYELQ